MTSSNSQSTDRHIQSIFGQNLRILAAKEPSISDLCRKLSINRTQFNRYLSGETSPRPLLLKRICEYFDVDARILLEPIGKQKKTTNDNYNSAMSKLCDDALEPISQETLPDGIYTQWTSSLIRPNRITFNMIRIYTEKGVRMFRVRVPDPLQSVDGSKIYPRPSFVFHGIIFRQGSGFVIIDVLPDSNIVSFTSYRAGYSIHPNIYPGMKLAGTSFASNLTHSYGPCFLEKVPNNTADLLSRARTPYVRSFADAPSRVRLILSDIAGDGFAGTVPTTRQ